MSFSTKVTLLFCGVFSFYYSKFHQSEKYISFMVGCIWMVIGPHPEQSSN